MASSKWTLDTAHNWLTRNGHSVGAKQVELSANAGIHAFGCADFLRGNGYTVIYFKPK